MAWRLAKSLVQLRDEVNAAYPNRSKSSDGTLGDPAHASRASRHNPNNAGVVCAIDLTHDPKNGCDVHALARRLVKTPHPNLEYVISNGQVAKRSNGFQWGEYRGSNPHDKHAHFAVGRGPDSEPTQPYDDTAPWGISQEDDLTPEQARQLHEIHAHLYTNVTDAIRDIQATVHAAGDPKAFAAEVAKHLDGIDAATVEKAVEKALDGITLRVEP